MRTTGKGIAGSVEFENSSLCTAAGISQRELFDNPHLFKEARNKAESYVREVFGKRTDQVKLPGISCENCSYAHLAALGAEVRFPEGGDFSMSPFVSSIQEGIDVLKKNAELRLWKMIFTVISLPITGSWNRSTLEKKLALTVSVTKVRLPPQC
jgi:hypothetical protein